MIINNSSVMTGGYYRILVVGDNDRHGKMPKATGALLLPVITMNGDGA